MLDVAFIAFIRDEAGVCVGERNWCGRCTELKARARGAHARQRCISADLAQARFSLALERPRRWRSAIIRNSFRRARGVRSRCRQKADDCDRHQALPAERAASFDRDIQKLGIKQPAGGVFSAPPALGPRAGGCDCGSRRLR